MVRPLVSVVLATYERGHFLARSLVCYEKQHFDNDRFELVVVDDHSTDDTRGIVLDWAHRTKIKTTILTPAPKLAQWRDCGAVLNCGIRAASGTHILLTHPEVMPGRTSVADCVKELENKRLWYPAGQYGLYVCCRTYYLSPRDQCLLGTVDWEGKGPLSVRDIENFYEADTNGHPDYCHRATDIVAQPGSRLPRWESFIFGGHSRETWKRLGGMLETQEWGAIDVAWNARRVTLGIPNYTCPAESAICVHQNHDLPGEVPTNRDMEAWKRELRSVDLETPSKLVYPHIDHLGW